MCIANWICSAIRASKLVVGSVGFPDILRWVSICAIPGIDALDETRRRCRSRHGSRGGRGEGCWSRGLRGSTTRPKNDFNAFDGRILLDALKVDIEDSVIHIHGGAFNKCLVGPISLFVNIDRGKRGNSFKFDPKDPISIGTKVDFCVVNE